MSRPTHRLAVLAVLAVVLSGCADQERGGLSPSGSSASDIAWLFWGMVAAGAGVFALVMVLLVASRRGTDVDEDSGDERRSRRLVYGGGVVLPVVVLVPLTVAMLAVGERMSANTDAIDIRVVGHQFWWEVVYPDGEVVTANEIHIPVDRTVNLELATADVIHSFWVPELAPKIDMIPGEVTTLSLDASEPGVYQGQCAEFCGMQHARMQFLVIAEPADEYERWLDEQGAPADEPISDAAEHGAEVFMQHGCASCHTIRGTEADGELGPDLTHLASRRTIAAGTRPNERGHLAGWISDPQSTKPGALMPPTPLESQELLDLVTYLEGLE